ncbi:MAG TPA: sulfurtransferase [Candidatus Saccharimonadales bacterium]|nr:sulfurtransferase [Candidatus Saccharimonadales bacterium]
MSVPHTTSALVDSDWCLAHLADPGVRFVEVDERPARRRYELGHIPGAVSWSWSTQLCHPLNRDIASPDQVEQLLRATGIGRTMHVVLYGEPSNWFAAWAYWLLRMYGFERVSLLDGGRAVWIDRGLPLSVDVRQVDASKVRPEDEWRAEAASDWRALRSDVLARIGDPSCAILDVRSVAEYRGEVIAPALFTEGAQRPGHIAGAISIPWDETVGPNGTFKGVAELQALFVGAGCDSSKDVITYCRIGERSSHTWFVLHELLGYERVRNYDGSWAEWGSSIGVPIELGA